MNADTFGDYNPFFNQIKMLHHADRLFEWKTKGDTTPIHMEINLINVCNQGCRWCVSMYSHISNPSMTLIEKQTKNIEKINIKGIDYEKLIKFVEEAKESGTKSITWSGGGEPTVYHKFAQLIENIGYSLEQALVTNGQFSPKYVTPISKNIKWVKVSLDTFNSKKYEYQKFSNKLNLVLQNIVELKNNGTKVGLNMNIAEWNKDEILTFASNAHELGVDYVQYRPILALPFELKNNFPYRNHLGENLLVDIKNDLLLAEQMSTSQFKVYVSWDKFKDIENEKNDDFGRTYKKCLGHYFMCVLDANGDLNVCMYHLNNEKFKMGNIYLNTFQEIWQSEQRKNVIKHCSQTIDFSKCQSCCKLHNLNKLLDLLEKDIENVNFI